MDRRFSENTNQPSPFYNIQQLEIDGASTSTSAAGNWNANVAPVPFSNNIPIYNQINVHQAVFQDLSQSLPVNFEFGSPSRTQERQNAVVQFPFHIVKNESGNMSLLRGKRKTEPDLDLEETFGHPRKQQITEEKMAECMSQLHINSETSSNMETETAREKRLYMCETMRKLRHDNILPQYLVNRKQNPCTALVLWRPPTRLLPALLGDAIQTKGKSSNDEKQQPSTSGISRGRSRSVVMESELDDDTSNNNTMDMDL